MSMPSITDALPLDMSGLTLLDLGGFKHQVCQWALEHGASSATLVDNAESLVYGWEEPGVPEHSRIGFARMDLMDWQTPADVVVLSNVIYHVKDPLRTLAHVRELTRGVLILRTSYVDPDAEPRYMRDGWRWWDDGMGHPNGTVWCRPSIAGLRDYLTHAGFPSQTHWEFQGSGGDHVLVVCPVSDRMKEEYGRT